MDDSEIYKSLNEHVGSAILHDMHILIPYIPVILSIEDLEDISKLSKRLSELNCVVETGGARGEIAKKAVDETYTQIHRIIDRPCVLCNTTVTLLVDPGETSMGERVSQAFGFVTLRTTIEQRDTYISVTDKANKNRHAMTAFRVRGDNISLDFCCQKCSKTVYDLSQSGSDAPIPYNPNLIGYMTPCSHTELLAHLLVMVDKSLCTVSDTIDRRFHVWDPDVSEDLNMLHGLLATPASRTPVSDSVPIADMCANIVDRLMIQQPDDTCIIPYLKQLLHKQRLSDSKCASPKCSQFARDPWLVIGYETSFGCTREKNHYDEDAMKTYYRFRAFSFCSEICKLRVSNNRAPEMNETKSHEQKYTEAIDYAQKMQHEWERLCSPETECVVARKILSHMQKTYTLPHRLINIENKCAKCSTEVDRFNTDYEFYNSPEATLKEAAKKNPEWCSQCLMMPLCKTCSQSGKNHKHFCSSFTPIHVATFLTHQQIMTLCKVN